MTIYEHASSLVVQARSLAQAIDALRNGPGADSHPYSPVVHDAITSALQVARLQSALRDFEAAVYSHLPDIRGEHDRELYLNSLNGGYVRFHGNADHQIYEELEADAQAAGFEWREFTIGIGAAGSDIVVAFGTHLAADLICRFLKRLGGKDLRPDIDAITAVQICQADVLSQHKSTTINGAYAFASPVGHAKFEVYVHAAGGSLIHMSLVRPDGEICGRKIRQAVDQPQAG